MLTLGFGMFSMSSFNYDELNKADRYILTFSLTKKQVVVSKYILVIGSTVIVSILWTWNNVYWRKDKYTIYIK